MSSPPDVKVNPDVPPPYVVGGSYPPAPNQGYPPQPGYGYPPQAGYSTQPGYPSQGPPPQGYPPQGYPPQGYPPQGYAPQCYPQPQGYPPHLGPSGQAQQQQQTSVVVVNAGGVQQGGGNCPVCRVGNLHEEYSCCGICLAIFFFPIGLICCLLCKNRRCSHCGATR